MCFKAVFDMLLWKQNRVLPLPLCTRPTFSYLCITLCLPRCRHFSTRRWLHYFTITQCIRYCDNG